MDQRLPTVQPARTRDGRKRCARDACRRSVRPCAFARASRRPPASAPSAGPRGEPRALPRRRSRMVARVLAMAVGSAVLCLGGWLLAGHARAHQRGSAAHSPRGSGAHTRPNPLRERRILALGRAHLRLGAGALAAQARGVRVHPVAVASHERSIPAARRGVADAKCIGRWKRGRARGAAARTSREPRAGSELSPRLVARLLALGPQSGRVHVGAGHVGGQPRTATCGPAPAPTREAGKPAR